MALPRHQPLDAIVEAGMPLADRRAAQYLRCMEGVRLVAVIVNWNTRDHLRRCLHALTGESADSLPIICIDNASSDGSAEMVEREFPHVDLHRNDENVGFARAVNLGIRRAIAEHDATSVALVNSDVVVDPAVLQAVGKFLRDTPGAAAATPALRHPDGRLQAGAAGFRPSVWNGLSHFLFVSSLTRGFCRGVFIRQEWYEGTHKPVRVDWVSGACAVVAIDAIQKSGLLDERYFLYGEDVEWFSRMSGAGASVWYIPWLTAQHRQGSSSDPNDVRWLAALRDLVRERSGSVAGVVFQAAAGVGLGMRSMIHILRWFVSRQPFHRTRAAQMAGYATAALFGLGRPLDQPPSAPRIDNTGLPDARDR